MRGSGCNSPGLLGNSPGLLGPRMLSTISRQVTGRNPRAMRSCCLAGVASSRANRRISLLFGSSPMARPCAASGTAVHFLGQSMGASSCGVRSRWLGRESSVGAQQRRTRKLALQRGEFPHRSRNFLVAVEIGPLTGWNPQRIPHPARGRLSYRPYMVLARMRRRNKLSMTPICTGAAVNSNACHPR